MEALVDHVWAAIRVQPAGAASRQEDAR